VDECKSLSGGRRLIGSGLSSLVKQGIKGVGRAAQGGRKLLSEAEAGVRKLLFLDSAVRQYTPSVIADFSGEHEDRQKAMNMIFDAKVKCPLQTLACGRAGDHSGPVLVHNHDSGPVSHLLAIEVS
jgi:hypothetical protein